MQLVRPFNSKRIIAALQKRYKGSLALDFSYKICLAELIGVLGFVVLGCGAASLAAAPEVFSGQESSSKLLTSALISAAFGFGIFIMISATLHNNSDQLNTAITVAFMASGTTPLLQGFANICSQILGAIIAAGFVKALLPADFRESSKLGANALPSASTAGEAFLAEALGMFIATYVILEIACNKRSMVAHLGPIIVGSTFFALLFVLGPISSGSFNPARSLGPAAVSGVSDDLWIWIFGPIVGALVAVPFHLLQVHAPSAQLDSPSLATRQHSAEASAVELEDSGGKAERAAKEARPDAGRTNEAALGFSPGA